MFLAALVLFFGGGFGGAELMKFSFESCDVFFSRGVTDVLTSPFVKRTRMYQRSWQRLTSGKHHKFLPGVSTNVADAFARCNTTPWCVLVRVLAGWLLDDSLKSWIISNFDGTPFFQ